MKNFGLLAILVGFSFCLEAQTVKIGTQVWMTKNLNKIEFNNGDFLIEAKNKMQWLNAIKNQKPAYCYFNFDPKNGDKYGLIYNWYAVIDPRGIAPIGFHVPSKNEWSELIEFTNTGVEQSFKPLKSRFGWKMGQNGNNQFGFNAKPVGFLGGGNNFFIDKEETFWWTYDGTYDSNNYQVFFIDSQPHVVRFTEKENMFLDNQFLYKSNVDFGISIRCIKD